MVVFSCFMYMMSRLSRGHICRPGVRPLWAAPLPYGNIQGQSYTNFPGVPNHCFLSVFPAVATLSRATVSAKRSKAHLHKQPSDISNADGVSTSAEIHSQRRCRSYIQRKLRSYATFCKHNNPSFALRKEGSATPTTDGRW